MELKEQEQVTGETYLYRRYMELGREARDASLERDAIKQKDIEPLIDSGVIVGDERAYLKFSYESRVSFNWEKAIADGVIPQDKIADYAEVKVIRVLRSTTAEETEQDADRRMNQLRGVASEMVIALMEAERLMRDAGITSERVDKALDAAGGPDVEPLVKAHLEKAAKKK